MDLLQLRQYSQKYISYCRCEKGLDAKTLKAYSIDLQQFMDSLCKESSLCFKEILHAYISNLHSKYAPKSVRRKVATLRAFFNYLEYEEFIDHNPFSKIRVKIHEPSLLPRTIPLQVISDLLQCAYNQQINKTGPAQQVRSSLRDIAVLELLFATGIRISELCNLKMGDVDLSNGVIRIFGKGSKERLIQIGNPTVLSALQAYAYAFSDEIPHTGWFFINRRGNRLSDQSVRMMINKYCQLAGIEQHITPHMFRHSFATYLLEEDVDIRYIQKLLGHSSIMTTQIYTHVSSKKQRDILATKHPRNKILTP